MKKDESWLAKIKENTQSSLRQLEFNDGIVACSDALDFLSIIPSESVDVVFLDPPFNIGKIYGNGKKTDRLSEDSYREFMFQILKQSCQLLKPGGALYLYHLPRWAIVYSSFLMTELNFRHWIAISMKNGFARGSRLYPAHYALLYFTKGEPLNFTRPKIPTPRCKNCNEYLRDYGGYREYVKDGINLSDIWDDISPVRHKQYKNRKANELSPVIPSRIAEISGVKGGKWVDPFAGTGTSLLVARSIGMDFAGCDIESENIEIVAERLTKDMEVTNG